MSEQLPHIETAFRDWLAEHHEQYEMALDTIAEFKQQMGIDELPNQVALPGPIPWTISELLGLGDSYWLKMLFFSMYMNTRHTYHVDEHLWEMLQECRWPAETPCEALLYLPKPAFALRVPGGDVFTICYDLISGEEQTGDLEIRIGRLHNREIEPYTTLHLRGTIDEGLERATDTILGYFKNHTHAIHFAGEVITTAEEFRDKSRAHAERLVNVLLYVAGEEDIVRRVGHYPEKPFKRHGRALSDTKYMPVLEEHPKESDVGLAVRGAYLQYVEEQEKYEGDPTGRTVRPHMRSPHPHLYHTGPGRSIPKVKYLGPIAVKGGAKFRPSVQEVE